MKYNFHMEGSATTGAATQTKFPLLASAMGEKVEGTDTQQGAASGGEGGQQQQQQGGAQSGQQQQQSQSGGQQQQGAGENSDQGAQGQQQQQSSHQPAGPQSLSELDDAQALAEFNKRFKTNFKSLDEIKPPAQKTKEELEQEKADRRRKALEYSLGTGKVKLEDYEASIQAKGKSVRDIALELFAADMKDINPDIKDDEIAERFKDHYREDLAEDNPLRKLRTKEMERAAQSYLSGRFGGIDSIDADYDAYEQTQQRLEAYGTQIKGVIDTLPKEITVPVTYINVDGKEEVIEYKVPIEDNVLKAVRKDFLSAEMYNAFGADKNNIKDKVYAEEMLASIKLKSYEAVMKSVLHQHGEEVEKRIMTKLKNIPNTQQLNLGAKTNTTGKEEGAKKPEYSLLREAQNRQDGGASR